MQNRTNLSIKVANPVSVPPDTPFTPVDRTLHTPSEVPKLNSYFPVSSQNGNSDSVYSNSAYSESEDILTDIDEPTGSNVSRTYSLTFTPQFDNMLMKIYSNVILLPTIAPFLGNIPPLGIVSRVATELINTLAKTLSSLEYDMAQATFDAQDIITKERLRNAAFKHILLMLVRRRLIDLCSAQFNPYCPNYTPQLTEPTSTLVLMSALASGSAGNGFASSVYGSMGWNPLHISSLLLNEQTAPRLRSSSLHLRKQSLSRVNSCSTSSWLHIGSITNSRSGHVPTFSLNPEMNGSTDSILLMHDYVSSSVIPRSSNSQNSNNLNNSNSSSNTFGHGIANMMDVQTPPSTVKGPFAFDTITPPANVRRDSGPPAQKLFFESERPLFGLTRSSSHCGMRGQQHGALTLNMDFMNVNGPMPIHEPVEPVFTLDSPFASATCLVDELSNHFSGQSGALDASSVQLTDDSLGGGLRNGRLIPESPVSDQTQLHSHRTNLATEFALSERKRDSLKLKRGIH